MEFSVATASRKWKKDPTRKRDGYGEAPGRTASTGGRDRPAPWSPRQLSRGRGREKGPYLVRSEAEGELRRPPRRGVTQVSPRRGKTDVRGRLSPTKKESGGCRAHHIPGPDPVRPSEARSLRVRAIKEKNKRKDRSSKFMFARTSGASGRGADRGKPGSGSQSEAMSAGTGQRESTFSRRGGPVAAKRSSGASRRQGESHLQWLSFQARRETRSRLERSAMVRKKPQG